MARRIKKLKTVEKFLSCDWGTSSFRLRLVETDGLRTIAEVTHQNGIAATFESWQKAGGLETNRPAVYLGVIREAMVQIGQKSGFSTAGMPLILSGMASSSLGMIQLPYKDMPFSLDGGDLTVSRMEAPPDLTNPIWVVSGARTPTDVMRGEEILLVGAVTLLSGPIGQVFVFPGTHSKHIRVRDGLATGFSTYMTGEFFALLSQKSVLAETLEKGEGLTDSQNLDYFKKGLEKSRTGNLLQDCFRVRADYLSGKAGKSHNYHYLSGLLIGTEIKEVAGVQNPAIVLVSAGALSDIYEAAFQFFDLSDRLVVLDAEAALLAGHARILERII